MTTLEFNSQLINLEKVLSVFALRLTTDKDDAKDLLQDTFLKALTYRDQFKDSTNLKAWAYTIMKNTFINNYRRNTRRNTMFDHSANLFLLSQNKSTSVIEPDSIYREKEINTMINKLPNEFRVPFRMYVQGYKYKEIAGTLGLHIGTVKSRIFITRKKLTYVLPDYN